MKRGLWVLFFLISLVFEVSGTTKSDREVFYKWINDQRVFNDCSLRVNMHEGAWSQLVTNFCHYRKKAKYYVSFLNDLSAGCFLKKNAALSARGRKKINRFYRCLDHDIATLQRHFETNRFLHAYPLHQRGLVDGAIARYRKLFKMFLYHPNKHIQLERGFALANRMFEYCFGPDTVEHFCSVLAKRSLHPIAELFYSTLWFNLVSEGWRHWHDACLRAVKKEYDQGSEVVYIAGGNDIYQLLKNNIFRIRVIDPMLPSQPLYYSEGWDWLITDQPNVIGDRLMVDCGDEQLIMVRSAYQENGTFEADLSTGELVDLPNSTTTWTIYEKDKNIGYVIFERRYCDKKDFQTKPQQTLLMSFNEMYYVALPASMQGWGIGVDSLPNDIQLHVKQLRKPVNKAIMSGIVRAEKNPFNFIFLGSCAT